MVTNNRFCAYSHPGGNKVAMTNCRHLRNGRGIVYSIYRHCLILFGQCFNQSFPDYLITNRYKSFAFGSENTQVTSVIGGTEYVYIAKFFAMKLRGIVK